MAFPLYSGVDLPQNLSQANRALLFDKFYFWDRLGGLLRDQNKEDNLQRLKGSCGDRRQIEANMLRHCELVEALGGRYKVFRNTWHVAIGMGIDHPLENGMVWHPTLGTPYIPGSSVKGMVRAWCEEWEGWEKEKIEKIFGSASEKDQEANAGEYIFFDALPVSTVHLTSDVMTPHMGKWYEKGGEGRHNYENTPGDWHTPVPVTFLTVREIKPFFAVAMRPGTSGEYLDELMQSLEKALQWIGIGAKTAAGYGRFSIDENSTSNLKERIEEFQKEREEAKAILELSPFEMKMFELKKECGNDPFETALLKAIESGYFDEERCEALKYLKNYMIEQKVWVEVSKAKRPERDKKYNRTRKVMELLKEC